jgi:acetyl esterase/lipase
MLFSRFVFDFLDRVMYLNCNVTFIKGIKVEKNVVYNEAKSDVCKADLYYKPEREGLYPVLLNIHGGGFVAGNKKFRLAYSKDVANTGYFVMSINYTLCPGVKFPEFLLECATALDWIKDNAEKYRLDLNNVHIAGDSAGAYIAAYLGILSYNAELRKKLNVPDFTVPIKGLVLYCGPYQVDELLTKKNYA